MKRVILRDAIDRIVHEGVVNGNTDPRYYAQEMARRYAAEHPWHRPVPMPPKKRGRKKKNA